MELTKAKRIIFTCISVFIFFCFIFLLSEIYFRIFPPAQTRMVGGEISLPINKKFEFHNVHLREMDSVIIHSKNNIGFRGENYDESDKRKKIFCIGGSTTECFYITDGFDWPAILQNNLNKSKFWVNNAGMDGHSSFGHIQLVNNVIKNKKPYACIFLIGCNDVAIDAINPFDKSILTKNQSKWNWCKTYEWFKSKRQENIVRKFGIGHFNIDITKEKKSDTSNWKNNVAPVSIINSYQKRIQSLIDTCKRYTIKPIFITQPCLLGNAIDPNTGIYLGTLQYTQRSGLHYWNMLNQYNQALMEICEKNNVFCINASAKFPHDIKYMYDYFHFTKTGANWLGNFIAIQLKSNWNEGN